MIKASIFVGYDNYSVRRCASNVLLNMLNRYPALSMAED